MKRFSVSILALLMSVSIAGIRPDRSIAQTPTFFEPYRDRIQRSLPPNLVMRLPERMILNSTIAPENLVVSIIPTSTPSRLTVSLFTCESGPLPCLMGSFVAQSNTSEDALRDLERHKAIGYPITLTSGIQGYFREGNRSSNFSSVMWQQGGTIYTISFLDIDRQTLLAMAVSMARSQPIYAIPIVPASPFPF